MDISIACSSFVCFTIYYQWNKLFGILLTLLAYIFGFGSSLLSDCLNEKDKPAPSDNGSEQKRNLSTKL